MPNGIIGPTEGWAWPSLELADGITDPGSKLHVLCRALVARKVSYGPAPGFKAKDRHLQPAVFMGRNFSTGVDGLYVDCSGFFAWGLDHLTGGAIDADVHTEDPDGSQAQRDWMARIGFKAGVPADLLLQDGVLRAGTITPDDSGFGHVWFCWNGVLIESHGGHIHRGPDDTRMARIEAFTRHSDVRVLWTGR